MRLRIPIYLMLAIAPAVSCKYTIKVKDGATAYQLKRYHDAVRMLEKEHQRAPTRAEKGRLAYLAGDSWRRQGGPEQALRWFQDAYQNGYGPEALKAQAYCLKQMERYGEAAEAFRNLGIEIGSPYEYRKEVTACQVAEGWKKEPDRGWRVSLAPFNSPQNDFGGVPFGEQELAFTSDRRMSTGELVYGWTGKDFMDIYSVVPGGASPQRIDGAINTASNEGAPSFNPAGTEVFFVRSVGAYKGDDQFNRLFVSRRLDGVWTDPEPLPFQKDRVNYVHPALAPDGMTLYFASDDPDGWGGFDVYAVKRLPASEQQWSEPRILPRNINSGGHEVFPYMEADTLYFSSDGLPGMGGLDVFKTYRTGDAWAPPINLKSPINSGSDDFAFAVFQRIQPGVDPVPGDLLLSGYVSSNRPGGIGGDDIYLVEQRVPPPAPPKELEIAEQGPGRMLLDVFVLEKIYATADNPNAAVLGRKPLPEARVDATTGSKSQQFRMPVAGAVRIELEPGTEYIFSAAHPGYLTNTGRFSTKGIARDPGLQEQVYELEIVLDRIFRDQEIVLENIYYDYDKWNIRPDAEPTLNALADVLRQNPGIRIQLGSHTDCRGNDAYNQNLSQRRAESAVNYLIGRGIDPARMQAVGYGESRPAVDCACSRCSESEHQSNRRTTFKIVE